MRKKFSLIMLQTVFFVILNTVLFKCTSEAKMRFPNHDSKLILENEPNIGEIVTIKLIKIAGYDDPNAELGCFFSEGLELVNSREYKISFVAPPATLEKGFVAFFYSGPLKKGETKEAVFKIRIPDGKKYSVGQLEIDLGEPEPPEWNPEVKQEIKILPKDEAVTEAKMDQIYPGTNVKLILIKQPQVGQIVKLKLMVVIPFDKENGVISCFLPPELEFINDGNYTVKYEKYGIFSKEASQIWGNRVIFYSGSLKENDKKEFIFKIRIPDNEKYTITGEGIRGYDILEIDLGEPEPPEWNPEVKQRIKIVPKQEAGLVGARARAGEERTAELLELELPKETPPPFRTEFKIRTKDRPSVAYWNLKPEPGQPLLIPLRYLVYSEEEVPKVEVNLFLPEGIELVNDADYQISQEEGKTRVLLYSGPMRFKECKAFYLQVKPQTRALFYLTVQTHLTNLQNEGLFKEDNVEINLNPKRY